VNFQNFFTELKRRNVYKVAVAYAVVGWLLIQVATQIFPLFETLRWGRPADMLGMFSLLIAPFLRGLRDDPRYKNLVVKVGLPTTS
jgi:hypothetical protein